MAGAVSLHTLSSTQKALQSTIVDACIVLCLTANLYSRPVAVMGSVRCMIFGTSWRDGSTSRRVNSFRLFYETKLCKSECFRGSQRVAFLWCAGPVMLDEFAEWYRRRFHKPWSSAADVTTV